MNKKQFTQLYKAAQKIIENDVFVKVPICYDYGEWKIDVEDFTYDDFSFNVVDFTPRIVVSEFMTALEHDNFTILDSYCSEIMATIYDDVIDTVCEIIREKLHKKSLDVSEISDASLFDIFAYVASGYSPNDAWDDCYDDDESNDDLEKESEDQYITVNGIRYKKVD